MDFLHAFIFFYFFASIGRFHFADSVPVRVLITVLHPANRRSGIVELLSLVSAGDEMEREGDRWRRRGSSISIECEIEGERERKRPGTESGKVTSVCSQCASCLLSSFLIAEGGGSVGGGVVEGCFLCSVEKKKRAEKKT